jgi:hypothetical protein
LITAIEDVTKAFTKYSTDLQNAKTRYDSVSLSIQTSFASLCFCKQDPAKTTKPIIPATTSTPKPVVATTTSASSGNTWISNNSCSAIGKFYDADLKYTKSVCYVNWDVWYTEYENQAGHFGMKTFKIVTKEDHQMALNLNAQLFKFYATQTNFFRIRIAGTFDNNTSTWFVDKANNVTLYSGAVPPRKGLDCLNIVGNPANKTFYVEEVKCPEQINFFLEFIDQRYLNTTITTTTSTTVITTTGQSQGTSTSLAAGTDAATVTSSTGKKKSM